MLVLVGSIWIRDFENINSSVNWQPSKITYISHGKHLRGATDFHKRSHVCSRPHITMAHLCLGGIINMKGTRVTSGLQVIVLAITLTGFVYGGAILLIHNTPAKCTTSSYPSLLQYSHTSLNSWSFSTLNSRMQGTENSLFALLTWIQQYSWQKESSRFLAFVSSK